ncbi:MAG: glycosyltransferase [Thiotrichaceae bacterium]|nr:glycosyltransferase [Thiotrichaceae bacterium]
MMHIALISTSYPVTQDGSEAAGAFVADFAKALARQVKVSVIAPSLESGYEQISENLSIYRFAVPSLPLSLLKPSNPLAWPALSKTLIAGQGAVNKLVENQAVDHIFALWALPSGYWAWRVSKQQGIPYSTWALGSDIWSLGKIPLIKQLLQKVLRDSQANFADGYLLKDDVEHLSKRPCSFLPSTRHLDLPELPALKTAPPYVLAFLGRWHPNKGIDLLLESLQLLSEDDWEKIAEVRIAGGGPLHDLVHKSCAKLQEQGRPIILKGYLDKAAAIEWFVNADYVLIPSRIESIPVVFSDAMKCQCPVICMPVGDLPRLVDTYQVGCFATKVSTQSYVQTVKMTLAKSPKQFLTGLSQAQEAFSVEQSVKEFLLKIN